LVLKPTKFATATIKTLCHPSRHIGFFTTQPGSFFQRTREAEKREPGNEVAYKPGLDNLLE